MHDCSKYSQLDEVSSFSNAAHGAHISYADKLTNWRTTSVLYTSETIRKRKLAILDEIKSYSSPVLSAIKIDFQNYRHMCILIKNIEDQNGVRLICQHVEQHIETKDQFSIFAMYF